MGAQYIRAYAERAATTAGEPGTPIRFIASTEQVARDGLIIEAAGWDLANFERNPVILWAHDLMGSRPPIGRAVKVFTQKKQLIADIEFDQNDEFARMVESKYRNGFLSAVSVGWDTREFAPAKGPNQAPRITKAELLEISAVPVGSDPSALQAHQVRALRDMADELEALVPDPDAKPDDKPTPEPEAKPDYRPLVGTHIPISQAMVDDANAGADTANAWEDAAAAMVRLYLPDARLTERERRRDYNRIAKLYRLAERESPEWVDRDLLDLYTFVELRGLFLEGEPDLYPELFREPFFPAGYTRAGAVLSKRNQDDLKQATSLIQGVLARAEKEAEQANQNDDTGRGQDEYPVDADLAALIAFA